MKFVVEFRGREDTAITMPGRQVGLTALDEARRVTGVPRLSPDKVEQYVVSQYSHVWIGLTEEEARASGRFAEAAKIEVDVPGGYLNRYVSLSPVVRRDETTGEVLAVEFRYDCDKVAVVRDWLDAGAPLEWGFNEEG